MRAIEKRLRLRVKALESELSDVKDDREKFRMYWQRKLKWFVELHGKGQSPSVAFLIEDLAKFLNSVKPWYWL